VCSATKLFIFRLTLRAGKTTAFLLPAIERLVSSRSTSSDIGKILVLAPTRELALQIEEEAMSLLAHHPYGVQSVIGGTKCAFFPILWRIS
jgi:superfamily II DNA/RNA helicase